MAEKDNKEGSFFNENGEAHAKDGKDALNKIAQVLEKVANNSERDRLRQQFNGTALITEHNMPKLFEKGFDVTAFSIEANVLIQDILECRSLLWKCLKSVDKRFADVLWREFNIEVSRVIKRGDPYDRILDFIIQELERQENEALITVLEESLEYNKKIGNKILDEDEVRKLLGLISGARLQHYGSEDLKESKLVINRDIISDIVRNISTLVDPITERELILMGYLGNIFEAMIITPSGFTSIEPIKPGEAYAMIGPDPLGAFGFKEKLQNTLKPNGKDSYLWEWTETIRIKILKPEGIAKWVREK